MYILEDSFLCHILSFASIKKNWDREDKKKGEGERYGCGDEKTEEIKTEKLCMQGKTRVFDHPS